jgi:UDP-hydrolysing UDP-N-acetyl-D-glucosamine 2-epimerase
MGEDPARVFVVGAPGIENIRRLSMTPERELAAAIGFDPREPFVLVTMHPATYDSDGGLAGTDAMLAALDAFPALHVVLTSANADPGGQAINRRLRAYAARHPERCHLRSSLGHRLYLAALARCRAVVGNSSSGIIEAPSLRVPTVNIGDRQRGRLRTASVIDCATDAAAVEAGIRRALSAPFRRRLARVVNPCEGRAPGRTIARILAGYPLAKLGPKVFNEGLPGGNRCADKASGESVA